MTRLDVERSGATRLVLAGRELVYFGGCGYLGLAHHPEVVHAAREGLLRHGVSSGASRETSGNARVHDELEHALTQALDVPAVLLTPEGYTANLALAQALASTTKLALIDELAHPSLFDAARAAGIAVATFAHGDLHDLERRLGDERANGVAILTDSVFPSRGEITSLRELSHLAREHGATLVIDDCHGTGVIGARGRGALEHGALSGEQTVITTTLSKALGCYGGVIAGSPSMIERARTSDAYVGTTPIPPALAHAGLVALRFAFDDTRLVRAMRAKAALLRRGFEALALPTPREDLPVFAFALSNAAATLALHERLLFEGYLVPHVRYPSGAADGNLRAVVTAAHSPAEIDGLLAALARHVAELR